MANYIKRELDTFEYDKRYSTLIEHRWCYLKNDKKYEDFLEKKEEPTKPKISMPVYPEKTGQCY